MVVLVGRWWNGLWGRMSRRDIWLSRETVWQVRAREGDGESGRELLWRYPDEQQARGMVERLMRAEGPGRWRELARPPTTNEHQGELPPPSGPG